MTDKKSDPKKKGGQKASSTLDTQLKQCQQELVVLQQEVQGKQDKLLRAYADIQNLQKRMEREREQWDYEVKKRYLTELVDLKELLEKASEDANPREGVKALLQHIESFFEKEHITYIDCLGKPFDHTCHYALSTIEKDGCRDGEIVAEVKKGYFVKERILRPSHVVVAKKKNLYKHEHEQEEK